MKRPYNTILVAIGILGIAALVLLLFVQDKQIKLLEAEVTTLKGSAQPVKEAIKEVEVPAKLTDSQQAAIDFRDRFLNARFIETDDDALYKLDSVKIKVSLNDAVKKVVSEDRVRNKFELILRRHGVKIDEKALVSLYVTIEGLWSKDHPVFLVYTPRIQLTEWVVVGRNGDLRNVLATLWEKGSYGFAGTQVAEGAILESVESLGEEFANKYLAAQEKDK